MAAQAAHATSQATEATCHFAELVLELGCDMVFELGRGANQGQVLAPSFDGCIMGSQEDISDVVPHLLVCGAESTTFRDDGVDE